MTEKGVAGWPRMGVRDAFADGLDNSLMTPFFKNLYGLRTVDFDGIVRAAAGTMPPRDRARAWTRLNHGTSVIEDENRLNDYLVAYGQMHRAKLLKILPGAFAVSDFNAASHAGEFARRGVSIVDWGCGQGLATAVLLDHFKERVPIQCVRLLEMSDLARVRAFEIVRAYPECRKADVREMPWTDGRKLAPGDFDLPHETPVIHLFSNILDVAGVDIANVAAVLDGLRRYCPSTIVAVGPQNAGVERIFALCRMMKGEKFLPPNLVFGQIDFQNSYSRKDSCTCFGLSFHLTPEMSPLPVVSVSQRQTYRLGASVDAVYGTCPDEWFRYDLSSHGNALMLRFAQNCVPPHLAVLNNMVARGWPSRAGLLVEEELAERLGLTEKVESDSGALAFRFKDDGMSARAKSVAGKIGDCTWRPAFDEMERAFETLLTTPIMVSRVQHAVLRGAMAKLFNIDRDVVRVLAVERDVECVELALRELQEMMERLSALSRPEDKVPHPRFEVCVVRDGVMPPLGEGERFDVMLDVAFYRSAVDTSDWFKRLEGRFDFGAQVRTAAVKENATAKAKGEAGTRDPDVRFQICTGCNVVYRDVCRRLSDGTFEPTEAAQELRYFLRNVFRKEDFRPGQLPILNRALQNRSVIGLLPTGGGKSLTYQLAGMMQPGIVLVVDPLRALMKNQVDGLIGNGITACVYINSSLTPEKKKEAAEESISGNCKFIFISPERLAIPSYRYSLQEMYDNALYFSYGVVDEVHCVSEWGHDFRFNYLHLGRNLHEYVHCRQNPKIEERQYVPLFGLTATASFDVLADVERDLSGLNAYGLDSEAVVRYENTNRLELQYRIERVPNAGVSLLRSPIHSSRKRIYALKADIDEARRNGEFERADNLEKILEGEREICGKSEWKYKNAVQEVKNGLVDGVLEAQKECFDDLLKAEAIEMMKRRFLERESIKPDSPFAQQIQGMDLQVGFDGKSWHEPPYDAAGIVFCPHKGFKANGKKSTPISVEEVWETLRKEHGNGAVRSFVGGGGVGDGDFPAQCLRNMDDFIAGEAGLMVATKAFGLGIDKANIRFVVEMNHPSSLESFVQEAGRAGRDRKMALATILLSEADDVDMDVVEHFHDQAFIGEKEEKEWLNRLFKTVDMKAEGETDEEGVEIVRGFLNSLYDTEIGNRLVVTIPFQFGSPDKNGKDDKKVQPIIDKLIYRLCCIGVVEDVECIFDRFGNRDLRVRLVRRDEDGYFAELRRFLERYFSRARAEREVEEARRHKGGNAIHKCVGYLTEFVYNNIARKRKQAMEDMHRFCMDGLRAEEDGKSWLEVNEDLKDTIYYYFNSKYARVGYEVNGEPYSLLDDMQPERADKVTPRKIIEKYMRVGDDDFSDGGSSPKDNVKHLHGAVRLISRGKIEIDPILSMLNAYCICFLGLVKSDEQRKELVKSLCENGFLLILERKGLKEAWELSTWFMTRLGEKTDVDRRLLAELSGVVRLAFHTECVSRFIKRMTS